jgi:NAD dependent epimerase/dehydratase family enzyme
MESRAVGRRESWRHDSCPTTPGPWIAELEQSDVCINLSGRGVNSVIHRQTGAVSVNREFVPRICCAKPSPRCGSRPRVWINASTATTYRHALDRAMDESIGELGGNEPGAPDTWNFSIEVAKAWESAFFSRPTPHTRQVAIRSAMTFKSGSRRRFPCVFGTRARRVGRDAGSRHAVCILDPRSRFCARHRLPDRAR